MVPGPPSRDACPLWSRLRAMMRSISIKRGDRVTEHQRGIVLRVFIARMRHDAAAAGQGEWSCLPASRAPSDALSQMGKQLADAIVELTNAKFHFDPRTYYAERR